jgi:phosphopantothenoylcysteine decarboxylase/phosphopantothenate--cysteine ligase
MNILLGVTGSISAYKACDIISGLKATGHDVKVVMTEAAEMFITEMALATLSGHPVSSGFQEENKGEVSHIALAKWADAILIAPASANTIAKLSCGMSENILLALVLAMDEGKLHMLAPAMNTGMLSHTSTLNHLAVLASRGWEVLGTAIGVLACGDLDPGKLLKPRTIVIALNNTIEDRINRG